MTTHPAIRADGSPSNPANPGSGKPLPPRVPDPDQTPRGRFTLSDRSDRIHVGNERGNLRAYAVLDEYTGVWTVYRADGCGVYATAYTKAGARKLTFEAAAKWCAGADQEAGNQNHHTVRALAGAR